MTNITIHKTKIIFFAALLVAMILPFSGMDFAIADKENSKQKTHKEYVEDGYIVLPGGHYVKKDTHRTVDQDKSIDENVKNGIDRDILLTHEGKTIIDLDKAIKKANSLKTDGNDSTFPVGHQLGGWNQVVGIVDADSMTKLVSWFQVPVSPATYDDTDTLYIFPGMQPHTNNDAILQPVLQFGNNGPCDNIGDSWVAYPYVYVTPQYHSNANCFAVSPGDWIRGTIEKESTGAIWNVEMYHYNSDTTHHTRASYAGEMDFSAVALETYGMHQDEDCDDLSGDIQFTGMAVTGTSSSWTDMTSSGVGTWCGMSERIYSSAVFLDNDN